MRYAQRLRLPLLVAGLLGAVYLLLIQERIALPNRAAMALWNLAHLPLFFGLTLIFDQAILNRQPQRASLWLQLLLPPLLIFAFGTEWLQSLTDRQPSWLDVLANCAGIALAVCWLALRRYATRPYRMLGYWLFALIAAAVLTRPALLAYADLHSASAFPRLSDFESFADAENWSLGTRVRHHARDGNHALQVKLPPHRFAGTTLRYFPADWSAFQTLKLSVFNPGDTPLPLSLRIHDWQHEKGDQPYLDRFNYNFNAAPGWTDIQLPLERVASGPRDRKLALTEVSALRVFYQGTAPADAQFYLDAVALVADSVP